MTAATAETVGKTVNTKQSETKTAVAGTAAPAAITALEAKQELPGLHLQPSKRGITV